MANPQKENGYTALANELLEAFCRYQFPPKAALPMRLCLFIMRKTYGYQKKNDIISLTQFQEGTGEKNRTNIVYWLNYLVQGQILVKKKISKSENTYGINKDFDKWLPLVQVRALVQVRPWTSATSDTESSATSDTHKRKKENTKEKGMGKIGILPAEEWQILIDLFKPVNPMYLEFYKNRTERAALESLAKAIGVEKLKNTIIALEEITQIPYAPKITSPTELKRDLGKLIAFYNQEKSKINQKKTNIIT